MEKKENEFPEDEFKSRCGPEEKAALREAKILYYLEYSARDIADITGIPEFVVQYRISGKANKNPWKKGRARKERELFLEKLAEKATQFDQLSVYAIEAIRKGLKRYVVRETELSPKDLKFLSDVLANVDRMSRLDAGKATEITGYEHLNQTQVKQEIRRVVQEMSVSDPLGEFSDEGSLEGEPKDPHIN